MQYVLIHGIPPGHVETHEQVQRYIEHIVYGDPPSIRGALVEGGKGWYGSRRFVALVEYPDDQETQARYTFERMGSFNLGAQLISSKDHAYREFGSWVAQYSGELTPEPVKTP